MVRERLAKCKLVRLGGFLLQDASLVHLNVRSLERTVRLQLLRIDGILRLHLVNDVDLRVGAQLRANKLWRLAQKISRVLREFSKIHHAAVLFSS